LRADEKVTRPNRKRSFPLAADILWSLIVRTRGSRAEAYGQAEYSATTDAIAIALAGPAASGCAIENPISGLKEVPLG